MSRSSLLVPDLDALSPTPIPSASHTSVAASASSPTVSCGDQRFSLLVPDGPETDAAILRFSTAPGRLASPTTDLTADDVRDANHLRVKSRHGIVDIMRGRAAAASDYDTVAANAIAPRSAPPTRLAGPAEHRGFKRLGRSPSGSRDRKSGAFHGELPIDPIPGLDAEAQAARKL